MAEKDSPAIQLLDDQAAAKASVAKRFAINNRSLIDAHNLAFNALASAVRRHVGMEIKEPSRNTEGQIVLIAQFMIGIECCEGSIAGGLYAQAAALLKQELETIAAIEEYHANRRREGDTPKIRQGITKNFGPVYGKFNELSHPSRHGWAKSLVSGQVGSLVGANLVPMYDGNLARFLYSQHINYIQMAVVLAERLFKDTYGTGINDEEKKWCGASKMILLQEGLLELGPEAQGPEADWVRNMASGEGKN